MLQPARGRGDQLLLRERRNDALDLRHLVGAEGDAQGVTQVVHGAERLRTARQPQRWTRPPVASHGHTEQSLDLNTPAPARQLGADRGVEQRPLVAAKQPLLGHRPQRGRRLRLGDRMPPAEVLLVGRTHEQVGGGPDVPVGGEDLDGLPLGGDHPETLDAAVAVASVVSLQEQRQRVAVRVLGALHEGAALGLAPGGLGDENGLTPDALPDLDTGAAVVVFLLAWPPAAELHGAVGDEVDPAPVRLGDEPGRRPRGVLAASCLAHENSAEALGNLDVGRNVYPSGVDVAVVLVLLVELCRVSLGHVPGLTPGRFRLGVVLVDAAPDLGAACGGALVDRIDSDLYTLAGRVPLGLRVQHSGGPAVLACLAEVVQLHAGEGAGGALADLDAIRRDPHLQVARLGSVDAAPVGADHQGEGFTPGVGRFDLAQAPCQGCCGQLGVARELVVLGAHEASFAKRGAESFENGGLAGTSSGRVGVRHRPPPAVVFRRWHVLNLARV